MGCRRTGGAHTPGAARTSNGACEGVCEARPPTAAHTTAGASAQALGGGSCALFARFFGSRSESMYCHAVVTRWWV